jgi:sugar phosphate isomerase/epimerase
MGYAGVEWAGLADRTPQEARKIIDDLGLKSAGVHAGLNALADPAAVIDEAKALGHDAVGVPYWPAEKRNADGYRELADALNTSGAKLKEAGLDVFYHNHDFEFQPLPEGGTGYEILLSETDPALVSFEVDMGWVWVGNDGQDPAKVVEPFGDRVILLHIKDFANPPADKVMAEVGTGVIDYKPTVAAAANWPVRWLIVEQDHGWMNDDPMASAAKSFEGLNAIVA